jgi:hypothetical protein
MSGDTLKTAVTWVLAFGLGLLLPLCGAAAPAPTNPPPVVASISHSWLQFLNGSSLHGRLGGVEPNHDIRWESPAARSPIDFRTANIAWIGFEGAREVPAAGDGMCRFRFVNGDELFGRLAEVDADSVELRPWFGGRLKAPRRTVRSIEFLPKSFAVAYDGPAGFAGWQLGRDPAAWHYRDGAFTATAASTLGRGFRLTGSCSVQFDLGWNGQFELILILYTDALDRLDYGQSSYVFYLAPGSVNAQRIQQGAGVLLLGQVRLPALRDEHAAHFEFRALRPESALELWVNGKRVQRWQDLHGFVGKGTGMVFFPQVNGTALQLSSLRVCTWQGRNDWDNAIPSAGKEDVVLLANRDRVTGAVRRLHNEKLSVVAEQTPLDIPMARLSRIVFGGTATNQITPSPREVRAYFSGGGRLSFLLEQWSNQTVKGDSPNFGQVGFSPQPVRQLRFNLNHSATLGAEWFPGQGLNGDRDE